MWKVVRNAAVTVITLKYIKLVVINVCTFISITPVHHTLILLLSLLASQI
jgi:hypothetical protein